MALLDILTGGRDTPGSRLPPLAKAIVALLAYGKGEETPGATPDLADRLEDFFKPSPGGGPTAKGIAGALLTGGMMDLVRQFRGAGKAETVDSWIGSGANEPVTPNDLSRVLTDEQMAFLTTRTGLSREELLAGLSDRLPKVVDALTPEGRLPTTEEVDRKV